MFKKPATPAKLAERRLQQRVTKVVTRKARAQHEQRARFITGVINATASPPSEQAKQEAGRLVERVRAAKTAPFLAQYRTGQ